jgi:Predicted hydrolases or acyltransferases (alpha/beta hydrolase superfamily)
MISFDNKRISLDDKILNYRVEGFGKKALLFLHGLYGHSGTWRNNISYFSKKCKVIAPSLPVPRNESYEVLSEIYVEIIREILNFEEANEICIIGNSFGGYVAIKYYFKYSDDVLCLVLEDSYIPLHDPTLNKEFIEILNNIKISVLIIWGEMDELLPVELAHYLNKSIETSELYIFKNAGHVPHWEKHDEFNDVVDKFLTKINFYQE